MAASIKISSTQNHRIKNIIRLNKRGYRDSQHLTVVEGQRECGLALSAGIIPREIFICPELFDAAEPLDEVVHTLANSGECRVYEVSPVVFAKIAYRSASGGILMVIPYFSRMLAELTLGSKPFLVIIDGAEKPGNVGAVLRTADAAGVDGLILTAEEPGGTDLHNPNTLRASLGAAFTLPVVTAAAGAVIDWLRDNRVTIIAATPAAQEIYTAVSMRGPTAIVLGSEADGLGPEWLQAADQEVLIPMQGAVDSLNLSVSAALLLYEVVRQRKIGGP